MRTRWFGLAIAAFFPVIVIACGLDDSVVVPMTNVGTDGGGDGTIATQDAAPRDSSVITLPDGKIIALDSGPGAKQLIYANSQTELYSFDVLSSTLTDIGPLNGCGLMTNRDDLGIDSTGQLYLLQQSDAIYKLDTSGNCTDRSPLSMDPGDIDKISGRNNGTPVIVALNDMNDDYYGIDLSTPNQGTTTKIQPDLFTDGVDQIGIYDFACSKGGSCWTALSVGCNPGSTSSCLYSFPDDGGKVASPLGAIGVQPAGLAYANQTLYSFSGSDATIAKIPLGVTPLAQVVPVTLATGTQNPVKWFGAASTSAYP